MEVQVVVMESGEVVLDESVNTAMDAVLACTVTDFGTRMYEIYFDGVFQYEESVDFEALKGTTQAGLPEWLGGEA